MVYPPSNTKKTPVFIDVNVIALDSGQAWIDSNYNRLKETGEMLPDQSLESFETYVQTHPEQFPNQVNPETQIDKAQWKKIPHLYFGPEAHFAQYPQIFRSLANVDLSKIRYVPLLWKEKDFFTDQEPIKRQLATLIPQEIATLEEKIRRAKSNGQTVPKFELELLNDFLREKEILPSIRFELVENLKGASASYQDSNNVILYISPLVGENSKILRRDIFFHELGHAMLSSRLSWHVENKISLSDLENPPKLVAETLSKNIPDEFFEFQLDYATQMKYRYETPLQNYELSDGLADLMMFEASNNSKTLLTTEIYAYQHQSRYLLHKIGWTEQDVQDITRNNFDLKLSACQKLLKRLTRYQQNQVVVSPSLTRRISKSFDILLAYFGMNDTKVLAKLFPNKSPKDYSHDVIRFSSLSLWLVAKGGYGDPLGEWAQKTSPST